MKVSCLLDKFLSSQVQTSCNCFMYDHNEAPSLNGFSGDKKHVCVILVKTVILLYKLFSEMLAKHFLSWTSSVFRLFHNDNLYWALNILPLIFSFEVMWAFSSYFEWAFVLYIFSILVSDYLDLHSSFVFLQLHSWHRQYVLMTQQSSLKSGTQLDRSGITV